MNERSGTMIGFTDPTVEVIVRAPWVSRYHLLEMSKRISVAEHQHQVAALYAAASDHALSERAHLGLMWALHHDLPETLTGDFPTHVKAMIEGLPEQLDVVEAAQMPSWWVQLRARIMEPGMLDVRMMVKACDLADTLASTKYIVHPAARDWVFGAMKTRLERACGHVPVNAGKILWEYARNV